MRIGDVILRGKLLAALAVIRTAKDGEDFSGRQVTVTSILIDETQTLIEGALDELDCVRDLLSDREKLQAKVAELEAKFTGLEDAPHWRIRLTTLRYDTEYFRPIHIMKHIKYCFRDGPAERHEPSLKDVKALVDSLKFEGAVALIPGWLTRREAENVSMRLASLMHEEFPDILRIEIV